MNNVMKLFNFPQKQRITEQHAAWLTRDACNHANRSIRAMAALCVGLQLWVAGRRLMLCSAPDAGCYAHNLL